MRTVFVLFMLTALGVQAQAADYHVATTGSDTTGTGSIDNPWATVKKGMKAASAGDTVYLRGGTYVQNCQFFTPLNAGTSTSPITLKSYPGETATIQGLLHLERPTWWVIDGVNVTWNEANSAAFHMVKVTGGTDWIIKNCEFYGASSFAALYITDNAGEYPGEPANFTVKYNLIRDTYPASGHGINADHLINVNTGIAHSANGIIERNILYGASNGCGIKMGGTDSVTGGCKGVTFRHNTVYDTLMNVMVTYRAENNVIERNLLQRTSPGSAPFGYGSIRGRLIEDNGNINRASYNYCFESKSAIDNFDGGDGVYDWGNNTWSNDGSHNPVFNSVSGWEFYPQTWAAQSYGRYQGYSITFTPSVIASGSSIVIYEVWPEWASEFDWIALYPVGASDDADNAIVGYYGDGPGEHTRYAGLLPSGHPSAPLAAGQYEWRAYRYPLFIAGERNHNPVRLWKSSVLTVY